MTTHNKDIKIENKVTLVSYVSNVGVQNRSGIKCPGPAEVLSVDIG